MNKRKDVITPNIIVVPMLKKVDETIVGIIIKIEKGLKIPPVRYKRELNWNRSYKRNKDAYESFSWFTFTLNCKNKLVINPTRIMM